MRRRAESDRLRVRGIRVDLREQGLGCEMGRAPLVNRDDQLAAGEPVELMAFELPPFARRYKQLGFEFFDRLRVLPDDTVVLIELQPTVPPTFDDEWDVES